MLVGHDAISVVYVGVRCLASADAVDSCGHICRAIVAEVDVGDVYGPVGALEACKAYVAWVNLRAY